MNTTCKRVNLYLENDLRIIANTIKKGCNSQVQNSYRIFRNVENVFTPFARRMRQLFLTMEKCERLKSALQEKPCALSPRPLIDRDTYTHGHEKGIHDHFLVSVVGLLASASLSWTSRPRANDIYVRLYQSPHSLVHVGQFRSVSWRTTPPPPLLSTKSKSPEPEEPEKTRRSDQGERGE